MLGALAGAAGFMAPHVAAAVVTPGGVVESFGDQHHRFELASVTKPLVAYGVLVASEEGTLGLDDPAGPPGSTVAHLLSHASGVSPDSPEQVLAPPGTRRIYSSAGYALLAAHLSAASQMAWETYLAEACVGPLEMRDAELAGHPGWGGIGSVADLSAFASELLAPALLSPETLGRARRPAFPGLDGVLPGFGRQSPCGFGLGFEVRDHKSPHWTGATNSPETFGHFGQSGTFFWVDPVAEVALVALSDRPFGDWAKAAWPPLADAVLAAHGAR